MWQDCGTLCLSRISYAFRYFVHLRSQTVATVHGFSVVTASARAYLLCIA